MAKAHQKGRPTGKLVWRSPSLEVLLTEPSKPGSGGSRQGAVEGMPIEAQYPLWLKSSHPEEQMPGSALPLKADID
jgi:hypothetical protein